MEFHLLDTTNNIDFQLPIMPDKYTLKTGNNNTVIVVEDLGEINLLGKPKLADISIESFFPNQNYSFCQYTGFPAPYNCVKTIENWRINDITPRLIITGTDVNMLVSIEDFEHGEQDGSGDVYFTLTLKEYKVIPS
jgi:hypothetical protein